MASSVTSGACSSYATAARRFEKFMLIWAPAGTPVWPVDFVWLAVWILDVSMDISYGSIKSYLSGIRFFQECYGFPWAPQGCPLVHRCLQFVKKKYGQPHAAKKLPISLSVICAMVKFIPLWPNLDRMEYNDLLFVTASVIGCLGFLRGGEFLSCSRSSRPVLTGGDLSLVLRTGTWAVRVSVAHPKARWWLSAEIVWCFCPHGFSLLDPVWLLRALRRFSPVPLGVVDAAFRLSSGATLSKAWMVKRTELLLAKAGIALLDGLGQPVNVKAASWRAGGVQTAKEAVPPVSSKLIRLMGRWASNAWESYNMVSVAELKSAFASMHAGASGASEVENARGGWVGEVELLPDNEILGDEVLVEAFRQPPHRCAPGALAVLSNAIGRPRLASEVQRLGHRQA